MSPLLQERATPAAAQPLQPLPLGEEQQQQQLEREESDSDSSGEDSDSDSSGEDSVSVSGFDSDVEEVKKAPWVCVLCLWWWVWPQRGSH